jgi:hypothetical protein
VWIHDSGVISLKGHCLSSSDPGAALWNEQAFRANQAPLGSWSEAVTLTGKAQTDCCAAEVSQKSDSRRSSSRPVRRVRHNVLQRRILGA